MAQLSASSIWNNRHLRLITPPPPQQHPPFGGKKKKKATRPLSQKW